MSDCVVCGRPEWDGVSANMKEPECGRSVGGAWSPNYAKDCYRLGYTRLESELREARESGKPGGYEITKAQIKHMVDRFLGWKLPQNFSPDAGISFKTPFSDPVMQARHHPIGTNLFDATQAESMVRYMIDGMPECNDGPNHALPPSEKERG